MVVFKKDFKNSNDLLFLISLKLKERGMLVIFSILIFTVGVIYVYFKGPIRGDEEEYANMAYILVEGGEEEWHLRNYFYPLIIVLGYLPVSVFIQNPDLDDFILISRIINIFFVIGSMILLYFLLERRSKETALLTSFVFSINWLVIYWGFRSTTQSPAMFFLLLSLYFAQKNTVTFDFFSGFALGFSFACWYGIGILLIPLLLFSQSHKARLYRFFGFIFVGILIIGLLDFLTYDEFLESEKEFFRFNVMEGKNADWDDIWDAKPWYFYFTICIFVVLGPAIVGYFMSFRFIKKDDLLVNFCIIASILFLVVFTIIEHKEYRFFLNFYPLFLIPSILQIDKIKWPKIYLYIIFLVYNISVLGIVFATKALII